MPANILYDGAALIDTSAVFMMFDKGDAHHALAKQFFKDNSKALVWYAVDTTAHESYTRVRYDLARRQTAVEAYALLRSAGVRLVRFSPDDEEKACSLLAKYGDHVLSFHDALCAVIMKRIGIFKVFTFDADFSTLGFNVIPGTTVKRR